MHATTFPWQITEQYLRDAGMFPASMPFLDWYDVIADLVACGCTREARDAAHRILGCFARDVA